MDNIAALQSLGLSWPSPAYIFGAVVFGIIGFAAWRWGRKTQHAAARWIGVALMLYPYGVSNTLLLYGVGAALCLGLWLLRG